APLTVTVPVATLTCTELAVPESVSVIDWAASSITTVSPVSVRQIRVVGCAVSPGGFIGSSRPPQSQPVQMGCETSPPSTSIHTPAPIGGTEKTPEAGPA